MASICAETMWTTDSRARTRDVAGTCTFANSAMAFQAKNLSFSAAFQGRFRHRAGTCHIFGYICSFKINRNWGFQWSEIWGSTWIQFWLGFMCIHLLKLLVTNYFRQATHIDLDQRIPTTFKKNAMNLYQSINDLISRKMSTLGES